MKNRINLIQKTKNFINNGHERSVKTKKNIIVLFALKGYSVAINLALIPLTLLLLDDYKYGVWITLFNMLSWISIFDIGIGNGVRNKFAESMANRNFGDAREYVSTGYILLAIISVGLVTLFIFPWIVINWAIVFNVNLALKNELTYLVGIVFLLTCIQFALKLIGTILTADHKPAMAGLLTAISNTIILIVFFFGKQILNGNLFLIGALYSLLPVIVIFLTSIILFNGKYKYIKPSIRFYNQKKVKDLFGLGMRFFVIQIAVLIIFQTDSLIIAHTLSPNEVTSYNIVFRYFGVITMLTGIILTPLWSAYTDAFALKDYSWIKKIIKKQLFLLIGVVLVVVILFFSANKLIPIWLQRPIFLNSTLLLGMAIFTIISVWNNIFSFLLNGLSRTKIQIITSIVGMIINIPISIYLAKILGNGGVIIGSIISLSFFAILGAYETYRIFKIEMQ